MRLRFALQSTRLPKACDPDRRKDRYRFPHVNPTLYWRLSVEIFRCPSGKEVLSCARDRYDENLQNDRAEHAWYCWIFFNTYTETYTFPHYLKIFSIISSTYGINQTTWGGFNGSYLKLAGGPVSHFGWRGWFPVVKCRRRSRRRPSQAVQSGQQGSFVFVVPYMDTTGPAAYPGHCTT